MQITKRPAESDSNQGVRAAPPVRKMRSLVLAWHDEESGDDLTVDVRGSERFLEGLVPLGFVPVGPPARGVPVRKDSKSTDHRVSWTVRLSRYWKPKSG